MAKKAIKNYIYAVGRRKSVSARVRLYKGNKESLVNEEVIGLYFPGVIMRSKWLLPFSLTKTEGKYYATVRVSGGGKSGPYGNAQRPARGRNPGERPRFRPRIGHLGNPAGRPSDRLY